MASQLSLNRLLANIHGIAVAGSASAFDTIINLPAEVLMSDSSEHENYLAIRGFLIRQLGFRNIAPLPTITDVGVGLYTGAARTGIPIVSFVNILSLNPVFGVQSDLDIAPNYVPAGYVAWSGPPPNGYLNSIQAPDGYRLLGTPPIPVYLSMSNQSATPFTFDFQLWGETLF